MFKPIRSVVETIVKFSRFLTELCLNKLSSWQWLRIKVLHVDTHRKHTKVIGKILVAGKHLTIGDQERSPPGGGKTRLSDTRGSHPEQES